jgi:hypothetical protein
LLKVWDILKEAGEPIGLELNPTKCEWSWLDPGCTQSCPIDGVAITPTAKIEMLGVPLGSGAFTEEYVKESLLEATAKVLDKLLEFEDTQAAVFLLRLSFGIVRATHFMRTTPISQWLKQAEEFDGKVRDTLFQCLGLKPTPESSDQASVSTTIGGLGIRRIVDHATGAFTASWHESQGITHESWTNPAESDCSAVYKSQKNASTEIDAAIMSRLVAGAGDKRQIQHLSRLDSPHANSWLTARPSCMDGNDAILPKSLSHCRCPSP